MSNHVPAANGFKLIGKGTVPIGGDVCLVNDDKGAIGRYLEAYGVTPIGGAGTWKIKNVHIKIVTV